MPIRDPETLEKIHITFRMQYMKDVVCARFLDEHTFATLSSLIFFNYGDIAVALTQNAKFLDDLFAAFSDESASEQALTDLSAFLDQFISLCR